MQRKAPYPPQTHLSGRPEANPKPSAMPSLAPFGMDEKCGLMDGPVKTTIGWGIL